MLSDRCFDVIDAPTYTKALIWFLIGNRKKRLILLLSDFLGISFTFFLSYFLSNYFFSVSIQRELYISVFLSSVFFMVIGLYLLNAYKPIENRRAETELAIITKSITFAFLLTFAVHFIFFKNIVLSRYIMILWWFSSIFTLIFFRFSIRELYKTLWRKGYLREKVLLVGSNDNVDIIREQIVIQRHDRFNFFSTWTKGYDDEFSKRLKELNIEKVMIVPHGFGYDEVSKMSNHCRLNGIAVNIVSDEFSISNQEISVDEFTGCLILSPSNSSPFSRILNKFTKRVMDIFISIFTLPTVFFFYAFIGIANKMEDGGPVIYRRKVVGKNGKEFDAFKFRSMLVNADNILEKNPELKKEFEKNYKLENDPRLTKVGALIRRLSIDELPQILNVFSGQMSIVGPRMKVKEEIEKYYGGLKQKLLTVKPGLTGFWQVNGRQKTNYDERVRMDMFYIDHWSIWMDIVILIKTVWKVIKKEGAI